MRPPSSSARCATPQHYAPAKAARSTMRSISPMPDLNTPQYISRRPQPVTSSCLLVTHGTGPVSAALDQLADRVRCTSCIGEDTRRRQGGGGSRGSAPHRGSHCCRDSGDPQGRSGWAEGGALSRRRSSAVSSRGWCSCVNQGGGVRILAAAGVPIGFGPLLNGVLCAAPVRVLAVPEG